MRRNVDKIWYIKEMERKVKEDESEGKECSKEKE
jgi:hypothetical protein